MFLYVKLELLKVCGLAKAFETDFTFNEEHMNLANPSSLSLNVSVCVVEFGLSLNLCNSIVVRL